MLHIYVKLNIVVALILIITCTLLSLYKQRLCLNKRSSLSLVGVPPPGLPPLLSPGLLSRKSPRLVPEMKPITSEVMSGPVLNHWPQHGLDSSVFQATRSCRSAMSNHFMSCGRSTPYRPHLQDRRPDQ
uniref:Secreted protein n=1 Tax=Ascaris lumbricoides TaxID=6252 RepID=A0A0M3I793_ASCLU